MAKPVRRPFPTQVSPSMTVRALAGCRGPYRHVTRAGYGPTLRVTMSVSFFVTLVTAKNGKRADPLEPSPS
jgi:hypothetical protein